MGEMPLAQAQSLVGECVELMGRIVPSGIEAQIMATRRDLKVIDDVRDRLQRLVGGGYRLERLHSTIILAREVMAQHERIMALQDDQRARMLQLQHGLNEVK